MSSATTQELLSLLQPSPVQVRDADELVLTCSVLLVRPVSSAHLLRLGRLSWRTRPPCG